MNEAQIPEAGESGLSPAPGSARVEFGLQLQQARLASGKTVQGVARALGMSQQAVYAWEAGIHLPSAGKLRMLAAKVGVTSAQLAEWATERAALARRSRRAPAGPEDGPPAAPVAPTPREPAVPAGSAPPDDGAAPAGPVPHELRAPPRLFVGRGGELDWLDDTLLGGQPVRLAVLHGMGGVGKTSMVMQWAHGHRQRFPDGELLVDLRGFSPRPKVDPVTALARMLAALGALRPDLRLEQDELAAAFRTAVAGRRMLIVLDDAADAEQVMPLLPGPGPAVIVTSRRRLAGLAVRAGAAVRGVEPLAAGDARDLIAAGSQVAIDDETIRQLVAACGGLPLALNLAAFRAGTGQPPGEPPQIRLDDPAANLSAVFSWSLTGVSALARRAFELIVTCGAVDVDLAATMAMLGPDSPKSPVSPEVSAGGVTSADVTSADVTSADDISAGAISAAELLNELVQAHLLEPRPGGRFGWHALLARWADGLDGTNPGQRIQARNRLRRHMIGLADRIDRVLLPQRDRPALPAALQPDNAADCFGSEPPVTPAVALALADADLPNFVAATVSAVADEDLDAATHLPYILLSYLNLRKAWPEWISMFTLAIDSASAAAGRQLLAHLHNGVGIAYRETKDTDKAEQAFAAAAAAYQVTGESRGQAMALNNVANLYKETGRLAEAIDVLRTALALLPVSDASAFHRAIVLHNLSEAQLENDDLDAAGEHALQVRDLTIAIGDLQGETMSRSTLAEIAVRRGDLDEAVELLEAVVAAQQVQQDTFGEADSRHRFGRALIKLGRVDAARAQLQRSAELFEATGSGPAHVVRTLLATLTTQDGVDPR